MNKAFIREDEQFANYRIHLKFPEGKTLEFPVMYKNEEGFWHTNDPTMNWKHGIIKLCDGEKEYLIPTRNVELIEFVGVR